ncbi:MAG TPA: phosphoenolpyruvate carboxykinase (ATP), partial [Ginsengibacter sp.]|nr:phosphoenolpyruvate carboxykinase (ATP) [Ginsengibacter sp.]
MSVPTILFAPKNLLHAMNIGSVGQLHYQLSPDELTRQSVERGEGHLSEKGALVISTGKFTGRSPKDKFIVKDEITENTIDWNDINQPIEEKYFTELYKKMLA